MNESNNGLAVSAIAALAREAGGVSIETIKRVRDGDVPVLRVPSGTAIQNVAGIVADFERTQSVPYRRRGTCEAASVDAMLKWLTANEDNDKPNEAPVFASGLEKLNGEWREPKLSLTSILNYSDRLAPAWHDFGVHYAITVAFPWTDWAKRHVTDPLDPRENDKWFDQKDFATFIDDHIYDVTTVGSGERIPEHVSRYMEATRLKDVATPSQLVDLARGLKLLVKGDTEVTYDPQSGEASVRYSEEHKQAEGGRPLKIPGIFYIRIPVLFGRDPVLVGVRLRYRASGGVVVWSYSLFAPDLVVKDEFEKIIAYVRTAGRQVYLGTPDRPVG